MKRPPLNLKRLLLKGSVLAVVVNGFLGYMLYQQKGQLVRADYLRVAGSLAATFAAIGLIAFIASRFNRPGADKRN